MEKENILEELDNLMDARIAIDKVLQDVKQSVKRLKSLGYNSDYTAECIRQILLASMTIDAVHHEIQSDYMI